MLIVKKILKANGPLLGVGLVSMLIVSTGALIMFGLNVSRSWDEEVKLIDGSVIVIKRHKVRERFGEIGQHGSLLKEEITFNKPGGEIQWVGDVNPVAFDFAKGKSYVVAYLSTRADCRRYHFPDSRFIFYEHIGKEWQRIRAQEFPDGFTFNLLRNVWYEEQPSLITLEMKKQRDWNPPDSFKNFDKNAIDPCPKY